MKLEYYSSLLDRRAEPPKYLSDDCLEYSNDYTKPKSIRQSSLTEPSTPTATRAPIPPESELSETESHSSVLSVSPVQIPRSLPLRRGSLSNSLESFHEPRIRRSKRAKVVRKASASSTSSYDTRPEPATRRMRKSASCHVKGKEIRRTDHSDLCRCVTEALQHSFPPPNATKSLPRNHKPHSAISRHLSDALRCEKDCLKILKSVVKDPGPTYSRRGDSEESYFEGRSSSLPKRSSHARYAKTAEIKKLRSVASPAPTVSLIPPPGRFQTIDRYEKKREKTKEECVLRIEDGDLWLEICKAVHETETRARKARPRD